jgi:hypothetical protein
VDSLPSNAPPSPRPTPSPAPSHLEAPGDIYPRGPLQTELCQRASRPDWAYLAGLVALDAGAIWLGSSGTVKGSGNVVSLAGPAMIGLAWGASVGGAWLALPKCSMEWVAEPPREGEVHQTWPLALSLALVAGVTAPIVNAIAIGSNLPQDWTTRDREIHVEVAALAGFSGALLPYLVPPRTTAAARELHRIRFAPDGRGGAFLSYAAPF